MYQNFVSKQVVLATHCFYREDILPSLCSNLLYSPSKKYAHMVLTFVTCRHSSTACTEELKFWYLHFCSLMVLRSCNWFASVVVFYLSSWSLSEYPWSSQGICKGKTVLHSLVFHILSWHNAVLLYALQCGRKFHGCKKVPSEAGSQK